MEMEAQSPWTTLVLAPQAVETPVLTWLSVSVAMAGVASGRTHPVRRHGRRALGAVGGPPSGDAGCRGPSLDGNYVRVDGVPFDDPDAIARRVANGPSRTVQLVFYDAPEMGAEDAAETVMVARRSPLVRATQVGFVKFPEGVQPVPGWREDRSGAPILRDAADRTWVLDASSDR